MTREEFRSQISTWDDIIDICNDHGITCCDDIYDYDRVVNYLVTDLRENCDIKSASFFLENVSDFYADYFMILDGQLFNLTETDFYDVKHAVEDEYDLCVGFDGEGNEEEEELFTTQFGNDTFDEEIINIKNVDFLKIIS